MRVKKINIVQSMYSNIKSRVKFDNNVNDDFTSYIGVRQGECLSPFLFSIYLNDLENEFILQWTDGFDLSLLIIFALICM